MSVQQITKALALRGVAQGAKLLLIVLANYADEDGECWPSQKRLAEDTGMTDRGVRKLLAGLVLSGFVTRRVRNRRDGSRGTDVITLHLDGPYQRNDDPPEQKPAKGKSAEPRAVITGTKVQLSAEPGSGLTTFEPSLEPSMEPSLKRARDFERFWEAYPEKKGKRAAELAFVKALKRGTIDQMIWAIEDAKSHSKKWLEGYIPNPATWLNQDRWNDEHSDRPTASPQLIRRHENMRRAVSGFAASADPRDDHG